MISLSHQSLDSVTLNVFRRLQSYLGSQGCAHGVGSWRKTWQEPLTDTNTLWLWYCAYLGDKSLFWFFSLRLSNPLVLLLYMWPDSQWKFMFRTFDVKNCHADGCLPLMHEQDAKCHATQLFMLTPTMLLGSLFEAEVCLVTTTDDTSGAQLLQVCRFSGIKKKIIIHFKTNELLSGPWQEACVPIKVAGEHILWL